MNCQCPEGTGQEMKFPRSGRSAGQARPGPASLQDARNVVGSFPVVGATG